MFYVDSMFHLKCREVVKCLEIVHNDVMLLKILIEDSRLLHSNYISNKRLRACSLLISSKVIAVIQANRVVETVSFVLCL